MFSLDDQKHFTENEDIKYMQLEKTKKLLLKFSAVFWIIAIGIYWIAGEQFHQVRIVTESYAAAASIGAMTDELEITQQITIPADMLTDISLQTSHVGVNPAGVVHIAFLDENKNTVAVQELTMQAVVRDGFTTVELDQPLKGFKDQQLTLHITARGMEAEHTVTFYWGNTLDTGRAAVKQTLSEDQRCMVNGQEQPGSLCVRMYGMNELSFHQYYWVLISVLFLLVMVYAAICLKKGKNGKGGFLSMILAVCEKYSFLLEQLVNRDFKTKYKRSFLGVAWSFINPLLTMAVQYFVFSTLFRNNTPNYSVYLLTGIVFFNFFNESISSGMLAISSNANLIKKVYVPRYIYPISKVLSSLINFLIALIPLMVVALCTGTMIRISILLLVYDICCFVLFILGMTFLLSTSMTFFQDTKFLWSVVSMLWMYMTPIFYTESIIPTEVLFIYRLNPLYQYISFARTCIIDGISPVPEAYMMCLGSAVVMLLLGTLVFRKNQDRFVLYL